MNERFETDPLDALRAADPVDTGHLSSASLARIRARVSEEVVTTNPASRRFPWTARLAGLAAGAVVVGAIALMALFGRVGALPTSSPGTSVGTGSAACVEQYSPATLVNRAFAFDGTVAAIDGDRVTFTVNVAYRGADGDAITLDAPGMTGSVITSAGGPSLVVGARYLVAGDDHFVWACGFTQPYDAGTAAAWSAALGG